MGNNRTIIILVSMLTVAVVVTGLSVLIWWLVSDAAVVDTETEAPPVTDGPEVPDGPSSVIDLDGEGIGTTAYTAAITRIHDVGDMFWWFYPTTAPARSVRPLLLWLDGVTGIPPSLLANFGMIGPYDFNLNTREDSWIDEFNLLFVDAPLGTGFSVPNNETTIPRTLDDHADHLLLMLNSFYRTRSEYVNAPLYIVGQESGAQIALQDVDFLHNLRGVVLANGMVSPALALTKLGFYLEEMGYIDYVGRNSIEFLSGHITSLIEQQRYTEAFGFFLSLEEFVNVMGETVAVNLGNIVEKLTRTPDTKRSKDDFSKADYFTEKDLRSLSYLESQQELFSFMDDTVAHALGINHDTEYDDSRQEVLRASMETFMIPTVDKVEYILENTDLTISIYNGNLDAVSNTPGQLEWVNNLQWSGQEEFRNAPRQTLVVNRLVEGYFRVTDRLRFYWMNAAGHWVPRDSPVAARRVMQLITGS